MIEVVALRRVRRASRSSAAPPYYANSHRRVRRYFENREHSDVLLPLAREFNDAASAAGHWVNSGELPDAMLRDLPRASPKRTAPRPSEDSSQT